MARSENLDKMIEKMAKEVSDEYKKINEEALREGVSVGVVEVTDKMALRHVPRDYWDGMK